MPNTFLNLNKKSLYYEQINKALTKYGNTCPEQLVFCISAPLGGGGEYQYDGFMILSPKHKITVVGPEDNDELEDYKYDIIDDISNLSKIHKYEEYIGRARIWQDRIFQKKAIEPDLEFDFNEYIGEENNLVEDNDKRLLKYIISLLTGSINELNNGSLKHADNLIDEIRNKIMLFDADQTRFLYKNYSVRKLVRVQGLSGTGKTELLFHKLGELYKGNEIPRIFFTCHNIALANELRERIPAFFNKMKVTRQIEWNDRLWVAHAWGSRRKPDSGLYAYVCDRYNIPFQQYRSGITYEIIFANVLKALNKIPKKEFSPCFDYMMIDENQDFPEVFFEVCRKITKTRIYAAGDIFQNIFYKNENNNGSRDFEISLRRCYRTDARTLMFAHTLGLGLKEEVRYNWFEKKDWELFGYTATYNKRNNSLTLSREPVSRFEGAELDQSVVISNGTNVNDVCGILAELKQNYPTLRPGDVSIIMIDDDKEIYGYMDRLTFVIRQRIGWDVLRGYEEKHTDINKLYLTNTNNVKGLEFPFVICITSRIEDDVKYRNKIYTMLTRSFLVTYLLIKETEKIQEIQEIYSDISRNRSINDIHIPNEAEKDRIDRTLVTLNEEKTESWDEFMARIFTELDITEQNEIDRLKSVITLFRIDLFDEEKIRQCISANREFV